MHMEAQSVAELLDWVVLLELDPLARPIKSALMSHRHLAVFMSDGMEGGGLLGERLGERGELKSDRWLVETGAAAMGLVEDRTRDCRSAPKAQFYRIAVAATVLREVASMDLMSPLLPKRHAGSGFWGILQCAPHQ